MGLCNGVAAYPDNYASYPVSVRQFRRSPFGLLQCMGRPKPPCHLLMLQGVTLAHKGLSPSGLSSKFYYSKNLIIFTIQGAHIAYKILVVRGLVRFVALAKLVTGGQGRCSEDPPTFHMRFRCSQLLAYIPVDFSSKRQKCGEKNVKFDVSNNYITYKNNYHE